MFEISSRSDRNSLDTLGSGVDSARGSIALQGTDLRTLKNTQCRHSLVPREELFQGQHFHRRISGTSSSTTANRRANTGTSKRGHLKPLEEGRLRRGSVFNRRPRASQFFGKGCGRISSVFLSKEWALKHPPHQNSTTLPLLRHYSFTTLSELGGEGRNRPLKPLNPSHLGPAWRAFQQSYATPRNTSSTPRWCPFWCPLRSARMRASLTHIAAFHGGILFPPHPCNFGHCGQWTNHGNLATS